MSATVFVLSKKEKEEFEKELKYRQGDLRDEIKVDLQKSADLGDLFRENYPFDAALQRQHENEGRIADLKYILRSSKEKEIKDTNKTIGVNDTVRIIRQNDNKSFVFKIVSVEFFQLNPSIDLLSIESPLGKLILGKKIGEEITLILPNRKSNYVILEILN